MKSNFLRTLLFTWLVSMSSAASHARDVTLQWDPVTDANLTGYKLYYDVDAPGSPFSGTGSAQGASPVIIGNQTTATLTGLDPSLSYFFAVTAYDASGAESAYSNVVDVLEAAAPTVSIAAPAANSTVSGSTTVSINASDNTGIAKVEYFVDGSLAGSDTATPYNFSWNSALLPVGSHTLLAKAYDTVGNEAQSALVTVVVASDTTPPTVSIVSPVNGSTVSGTTAVSITAADNIGVSKVDLYLNGTLYASYGSAPYNISINTSQLANGSYTLTVKAYDTAGNVGQSAAVAMTVNNPVADTIAPTVTAFSVPATAASLSVPITAFTATDNTAVNGFLVTETATPPAATSATWKSSAPASFTFTSAGSKTLYGWAKDAAGNVSAAKSATVTIAVSTARTTADPLSTEKTQAILDYLTNLPNLASNKIVSGQSTGVNWNTDNLFNDINAATGKFVGLAGFDYFYANNATTNNQIIDWSNANGLVTIHSHWNNPVTGGSYSKSNPSGPGSSWDTANVDFAQLITNGTPLNNTFKGYLDAVASGLQTLQDNNVTVLFRPFHEMNGAWFWWGTKDPTQFKNVWKYTFNYLTQTKGLHNLLWVYSSNATVDTAYYPGSAYVDVVGIDLYGSPTISKVAGYDQLATLNKPFGITEWGPCAPSGCTSPVDFSPVVASLKANMPKTAFWMQWAETFSMKYNTGAAKVLTDPLVVTRDEISIQTGSDSTPPAVAISTPANNATVSGTVNISADASDNTGVARVELYVNGVLNATDTTAPYTFAWNTTTVVNGTQSLTTRAYDAAGNAGQSAAVTVTVNNQATDKVLPAVAITEPGNNWNMNGTISFSASATDNVGVTKLEYYADGKLVNTYAGSSYLYRWDTTTVANGSHSLAVKAYDAAGNVGQSSAVTITVSNVVADTTAPVTAVTAPAANATASGTVSVTASASDAVGVTRVEFYVNGVLKATDTTAPYAFSWDSTAAANGAYTLSTWAYDVVGNVGQSAALPVNVANTVPDTTAPVTAVTAPAANATASGTVSVTASASDAVGVTRVEFYVNGVLKATDTTAPYAFSWDSTAAANGAYTLSTKAYDAAGNAGQSAALPVKVANTVPDTTAPVTAVTAPAASATVSGTVSVTATASDSVGVTRVEFYVNGVLKATDTTAPYAFSWDSTAAANGAYTLSTKAYDAAGNAGQSAAVSVTVNNQASDKVLPAVAITEPGNNWNMNGTISFSASATDNVGVTKLEYYADGKLVNSYAGSSYLYRWDTTTVANGSHSLAVKAYDAAGNVGQSSAVTITVSNAVADTLPPTVNSFTLPATASALTVQVTSLTASDSVGVTGYLITESATAPLATAPGWSVAVPTAYQFSGAGVRTAYAWAKDAAGNVSASRSATLIIASAVTSARVGIFNKGLWYLDINGDGVWNLTSNDQQPSFGFDGATPVTGDWNGTGATKIGVYDKGTWYLDNDGNGVWDGSVTDRQLFFGFAGSDPVTGDWNGDGKTKIGAYDRGTWYLDLNGNGKWDGSTIDRQLSFGFGGATPVTGDWNGDGKIKIGVYDRGTWYLDLNGNGKWDGSTIDRKVSFGVAGASPVTGDWNGDGKTDVGTFDDGTWYLDLNGNGSWNNTPTDRLASFGFSGAIPVAGKW